MEMNKIIFAVYPALYLFLLSNVQYYLIHLSTGCPGHYSVCYWSVKGHQHIDGLIFMTFSFIVYASCDAFSSKAGHRHIGFLSAANWLHGKNRLDFPRHNLNGGGRISPAGPL